MSVVDAEISCKGGRLSLFLSGDGELYNLAIIYRPVSCDEVVIMV